MRIAIQLILIFAVGCATQSKYEAKVKSWEGASKENLMISWGAPARIVPVSEGKEILEYHYTGNSSAMYHQSLNMVTTSTPQCVTSFFVEHGMITSWRYSGNACKSMD